MGKASSSKKVARAARAAGKPGGGRNLGWPALIGGVVILGALLIFISRGKTDDAVAPKLGDHWHAAYGIYDCDHMLAPLTDQLQDKTGLHTHGDGLMHIHPFGTRYTGKGANIGNWGITTGLKVTDTSIEAPGMKRKNGDKCGSDKGTLKLMVWDGPTDDKGTLITKDLADYAPQEFSMWTLAFVPEGTDIPKPDDAAIAALQAPADVTGAQPPQVTVAPTDSSVTTIPTSDSTSSTAPGDTTPTTAPGDTTPSTEPSTTVTTAAP
jgi:hypothetical protein